LTARSLRISNYERTSDSIQPRFSWRSITITKKDNLQKRTSVLCVASPIADRICQRYSSIAPNMNQIESIITSEKKSHEFFLKRIDIHLEEIQV
jgi:hypothetical protein